MTLNWYKGRLVNCQNNIVWSVSRTRHSLKELQLKPNFWRVIKLNSRSWVPGSCIDVLMCSQLSFLQGRRAELTVNKPPNFFYSPQICVIYLFWFPLIWGDTCCTPVAAPILFTWRRHWCFCHHPNCSSMSRWRHIHFSRHHVYKDHKEVKVKTSRLCRVLSVPWRPNAEPGISKPSNLLIYSR